MFSLNKKGAVKVLDPKADYSNLWHFNDDFHVVKVLDISERFESKAGEIILLYGTRGRDREAFCLKFGTGVTYCPLTSQFGYYLAERLYWLVDILGLDSSSFYDFIQFHRPPTEKWLHAIIPFFGITDSTYMRSYI